MRRTKPTIEELRRWLRWKEWCRYLDLLKSEKAKLSDIREAEHARDKIKIPSAFNTWEEADKAFQWWEEWYEEKEIKRLLGDKDA